MDKDTTRKIKQFFYEAANKYPGIIAAYLFGSYAKNNQTANSDIDIALIFDKLEDQFDMQVKLIVIGSKFDNRIEPHPMSKEDFEDCNYQLAYEIKKYGKVIEADFE